MKVCGSKTFKLLDWKYRCMEDYVYVIISLASMFTILVAAKMFKPDTNRKQAKREVQDTAQKEVIASKDITITTLKNELRSLNGKLTRFRDQEPEELEIIAEGSGKQVTWEEIQSLVKASYPKYAPILPLLKKQIMEATEGMSMEEILTYVKQFTGNQQSQGSSPQESVTWNPNWA